MGVATLACLPLQVPGFPGSITIETVFAFGAVTVVATDDATGFAVWGDAEATEVAGPFLGAAAPKPAHRHNVAINGKADVRRIKELCGMGMRYLALACLRLSQNLNTSQLNRNSDPGQSAFQGQLHRDPKSECRAHPKY